jgi:hypothetical protein
MSDPLSSFRHDVTKHCAKIELAKNFKEVLNQHIDTMTIPFKKLTDGTIDVIPRHVPISLLNLLTNSVYGKDGGYAYAQRYYQYKLSMKRKGIIQAANNRESGHYPHMTEKAEPCGYCDWASDKDTHLGSISNYCPNCGRKLTNG